MIVKARPEESPPLYLTASARRAQQKEWKQLGMERWGGGVFRCQNILSGRSLCCLQTNAWPASTTSAICRRYARYHIRICAVLRCAGAEALRPRKPIDGVDHGRRRGWGRVGRHDVPCALLSSSVPTSTRLFMSCHREGTGRQQDGPEVCLGVFRAGWLPRLASRCTRSLGRCLEREIAEARLAAAKYKNTMS